MVTAVRHSPSPQFSEPRLVSKGEKSHIYLEDNDPVQVEQLTLDEAREVLARARGELHRAYNSAHSQAVLAEIAELEGQIEWLESEAEALRLEDAAVEHAMDLWADRGLS